MEFQLKPQLEQGNLRRRGLAFSIAVHLLAALFVIINPDFLKSTPTRVVRIAGEEFDRDRFEIRELILPPELVQPQPEPPAIAENTPPAFEPPPPPPPPPPEPEPVPPPPVIGPDDVIAEGARPDAPPNPSEGNSTEPPAAEEAAERAGDGEEESGSASEPGAAPAPAPEEEPAVVAENTNPDALRLPDLRQRAESIIDETLAERQRQAAQGRRPGVERGAQELPNFSTAEPTILSDTRGYDFGPYMNQVINRVRVNWYSLIPEAARLGRRGRVVLIFTIVRNGGVEDLRIVANSGTDPLDRAAFAAIQASNPFPRLPAEFDDDHIVLQFTFLYNMSQ